MKEIQRGFSIRLLFFKLFINMLATMLILKSTKFERKSGIFWNFVWGFSKRRIAA